MCCYNCGVFGDLKPISDEMKRSFQSVHPINFVLIVQLKGRRNVLGDLNLLVEKGLLLQHIGSNCTGISVTVTELIALQRKQKAYCLTRNW